MLTSERKLSTASIKMVRLLSSSLVGLTNSESQLKTLINLVLKFQVILLSMIKLTVDLFTEIKRYLYFFFAPTLIYRDEYVRTRRIRWNIVFKNGMTFLFLIFYVWSIFKALCIPLFKDSVENPGGIRQFFSQSIFSTISGIVCLLSLFYGILHCWLNLFGELL